MARIVKAPTVGAKVIKTTNFVPVLQPDTVTNAILAEVPNNTLKGNDSGATANPQDLTTGEVKVMLSLDFVDNTADLNKPISTATQAALDLKADEVDLTSHTSNTSNPHSVTKSQVGLGNADNTSDVNKPISSATQTALNLKEDTANKGAIGGYAELDGTGKVPAGQLPSYVDDVLEYANFASFPVTGTSGVIYIAIDTNVTYRWGGSSYVAIGSSLALGETSTTAYRGDRGKTAYDHTLITTGNPHNVTKTDVGLGNVDNTSDANKPVSTAQNSAIANRNLKSANLSDVTNAATARNNLGVPAGSGTSTGTNTGDQDLSGLVPYTGATTNVALGANSISATGETITGTSVHQYDANNKVTRTYYYDGDVDFGEFRVTDTFATNAPTRIWNILADSISFGLSGLTAIFGVVGTFMVQSSTQSHSLNMTTSTAGTVAHTISGSGSKKYTFDNAVEVPTEVYGAGWNGKIEVPTKDALYDIINTLAPASGFVPYTGATGDINITTHKVTLDGLQSNDINGITIYDNSGVAKADLVKGDTSQFYTNVYFTNGLRQISGNYEQYGPTSLSVYRHYNDDTKTLIGTYADDGEGGEVPAITRFVTSTEVLDETYGSGWNGKTEIPTKNAIYDAFNGTKYGTSPYVAKTANYTATATDEVINCTANTFTITLPTASGTSGKRYTIKNIGTGVITIDGDASETIDGALTITIYQYDSRTLISDGTNWIIC